MSKYILNRIIVSSASFPTSETIDFTFPVNPSEYNPEDSTFEYQLSSLHGGGIHQQVRYDNRPRTMIWRGFPIDYQEIEDIIQYFQSIEGEIRRFNFQDISSANERWPSNLEWKKARILYMRTTPRSGGRMVYDTVELKIQPEA